jgi:thiamine-phosphate pyrophosphorylase
MKLVIMTKSTFFVEEDKILASLFDEGLDALHLSKPGSAPMLCERLLTLLPDECHRRITVHEHFYLREEFGLKSIHLDTLDTELPYGYKGGYSCTCRSLSQLQECKKKASYVFLQNLFDSQSNPNDTQTFTEEELKAAAKQGLIDRHVYALGGINLDNIRMVRDLGFEGVVVCGDLWNRFNIHQEQDYKDLIGHFKKWQKAVS